MIKKKLKFLYGMAYTITKIIACLFCKHTILLNNILPASYGPTRRHESDKRQSDNTHFMPFIRHIIANLLTVYCYKNERYLITYIHFTFRSVICHAHDNFFLNKLFHTFKPERAKNISNDINHDPRSLNRRCFEKEYTNESLS